MGVDYKPLNSALWHGSIDDIGDVAAFSHELSAELQRRPDWEGQVFRGSKPGRPAEAYDLDRYEPGNIVIEDGYTSSSATPDGAFKGEVTWFIDSKHGKYVGDMASPETQHESEVLFDRFSRFEVKAREQTGEGTWEIYMKEL